MKSKISEAIYIILALIALMFRGLAFSNEPSTYERGVWFDYSAIDKKNVAGEISQLNVSEYPGYTSRLANHYLTWA